MTDRVRRSGALLITAMISNSKGFFARYNCDAYKSISIGLKRLRLRKDSLKSLLKKA